MGFFDTNIDDKNDWVDYALFFLIMFVAGIASAAICTVIGLDGGPLAIVTLIVSFVAAWWCTKGEPKDIPKTGDG